MRPPSRRDVLTLGAAAVAAAAAPAPAASATEDARTALDRFTAGKAAAEDLVTLDLPEIAENGNAVPLTLGVASPMSPESYVKRVLVLADGNPRPAVATFHFSPKSGAAAVSTRIRLARSQNVIAVAELSDGSFHKASRPVKVTIGGCGG